MITTLLTAVLLSQRTPPAWMDWMIAGYAFAYDEKHQPVTVFDAKSGYYLVRGAECDGGILGLVLTNQNEGDESIHLVRKALQSLSTGRGISIGDTPSRVERILGKPWKIEKNDVFPGATTYCYEWVVGVEDEGNTYTESYSFKKKKLVRINFHRDMGGAIILKSDKTAVLHTPHG